VFTRSIALVACRVAVCVAAGAFVAGCASHVPRSQRVVVPDLDKRASDGSTKDEAADTGEPRPIPATESLESFIAKTRALAAAAHPADRLKTIEKQDPGLAAARLALTVSPVAENYRRVGVAYLRLGVLDAAYDNFKAALRLDSSDGSSFEGLARVWRDWGLPNLGLGDAYRAVYHAPASATGYNTLGTILQRLGQTAAAQTAFEAALRRDPNAAYALNNLCYTNFQRGQFEQAIAACHSALRVQPDLAAAYNNLGLAYWARGDRKAAEEAFAAMSAPGTARYNTGIAFLGSRQYWQAAQAFEDAGKLSPELRLARGRAKQSRTIAAAGPANVGEGSSSEGPVASRQKSTAIFE
jgi:tetratricopeptide (TPR) repeat protein